MSATIIDGKAFAEGLRERVAALVPAFVAKAGRKPGLTVVLVGEDPASGVYVRSKGKATEAAGMKSDTIRLPAETSQTELLDLVRTLNADETVDGILVQLPLPKQIDENAVIAAIDPDKDVDGFTPVNAGQLATGLEGFVPCTPLGCPDAAQGPARRSRGQGGGRDRPLQHRRQADGAIAARRKLHRHDRAFEDKGSAECRAARRYRRRRRRPAGNGQGRLDQGRAPW